jgi:TolB-like protein
MFRAENRAAFGQVISGSVHDPSGTAIPNVTIDIVDTATSRMTQTKSDVNGRFAAPVLPSGGPYTVTAHAPGFARKELTLTADQTANVDIALQIGAITETVAVTAGAPALQVAVMDFQSPSSQAESGRQAADLISSQLGGSGQVRVVDREKVQEAAGRRARSAARPPSASDAAAIGREVGADKVVTGSVRQDRDSSSDKVAVKAEVIDTKDARAVSKVAADGSSLQGATNQVGAQLASRLGPPLSGSVTRFADGIVTITFQAPANAKTGDRLEVYRGRRKIGDVTLTTLDGQTGAGKFSGSPSPRTGDRVTSPR